MACLTWLGDLKTTALFIETNESSTGIFVDDFALLEPLDTAARQGGTAGARRAWQPPVF